MKRKDIKIYKSISFENKVKKVSKPEKEILHSIFAGVPYLSEIT